MTHPAEGAPDADPDCLQGSVAPTAAAVQPLLTTTSLGRHWVHEPVLASTNRTAAALAGAGAPAGLVVTAEAQSAGRGRQGRVWHSPPGLNLYVSVVLRPAVAVPRVPQIALVTGLALCRALRQACAGVAVSLKWPNDLWVGSRKLAGILCEMDADGRRLRHVVVGVGLNVNLDRADFPGELSDRATSLRLETGLMQSRPRLLAAFLNALEPAMDDWLHADDLGPFLEEMDRLSMLRGRRLRIEAGQRVVEGLAVGLAADGRLRLCTAAGGEVLIHSGDAHILPDMPAPAGDGPGRECR